MLVSYRYCSIATLEKLIDQKVKENTAKMDNLIPLIMKKQIVPIKLLENCASIIKYDIEERLCEGPKDLDWDNNLIIKEVLAIIKNKKDEAKYPRKKNKKGKKEKMC